jgi:hypothetical protein
MRCNLITKRSENNTQNIATALENKDRIFSSFVMREIGNYSLNTFLTRVALREQLKTRKLEVA